MEYLGEVLGDVVSTITGIAGTLVLTTESIILISLGELDDLTNLLLWAIMVDLISGIILDSFTERTKKSNGISNERVIRKIIIFLTVSIAILVDKSLSNYGILLGDGKTFNMKNGVILHWVASECYHSYYNLERIGISLGGWKGPKALKNILYRMIGKTDKLGGEEVTECKGDYCEHRKKGT